MPDHRRATLRAAAIGILVYAVFVVIYGNLVPYLGIRFFVEHLPREGSLPTRIATVQQVSADPADPKGSPSSQVPMVGDTLIRLAGVPIEADQSPLGTIVNTIANLRDEKRFPGPVLQDLQSLSSTSAWVAKVGGDRYVRLEFSSPPGDSRGSFARWYKVDRPPVRQSLVSVAWLVMESIVFWFGWLVFRRRPEDDSAALFFLMCIVTVGAFMGWYYWFEIASNPAAVFVFAACALAVPQVSLHFHLVAPEPKRFLLRYPRAVWLLLYGLPGILQLGILWSISRLFYTFRHGLHESGAWWEGTLGMFLWAYIGLGAVMFLGCLASLIHGYLYPRHPSHLDPIRWLLGGSLVASLFIAYSFYLAFTDHASFVVGGATWAMFAASSSFVIAYAVSILRYRLLRLEEIVEHRGWTYLLIRLVGTVSFWVCVVAAILTTPQLFQGIPPQDGVLSLSFLVLVLYLLSTMRSWFGSILDRRFYRERSQLDWAMRRMREAVGNLADADMVRHRVLVLAVNCVQSKGGAVYQRGTRGAFSLAETIGDGYFPDRIEAHHPLVLKLKEGDLLQTNPRPLLREDAITHQLRGLGAELAQPFIYEDEFIGFLLLGPRREGMYGSAELGFLAGFVDLGTITLHSAQSQETLEKLNADLRHRIDRVSKSSVPEATPRLEVVEAGSTDAEEAPMEEMDLLRGRSASIRQIMETVRKVASSPSTVLIRGESGTGKTLLAEVIHRRSPRASGPFVKVHCAALSPSLLESELFGHVKGAYTGAIRDKVGRFQMADGGTLFLDEIGDVSLDTQTKLLRVIQEMTFEPVGSSESLKVDVRIMAATHQPLEELIRRGRMREDLYYRLNVINIRMPSLRDRPEDIPDLAYHFLTGFASKAEKTISGISPEAMTILKMYDWPGNIRELQNAIEYAVVMSTSPAITPGDLPSSIHSESEGTPELSRPIPSRVSLTEKVSAYPSGGNLAAALDEVERSQLLQALEMASGNKAKAAQILGIPRSTYCSKLKKYGLL